MSADQSKELRGTTECPICGWPEPHSHSPEEIAERPLIEGARQTFEREAREFMAGPHFQGPRTGYWWGFEAEQARRKEEGTSGIHGWAHRHYPQGPYSNEFVEVMWQFWLMAWKAGRRPFTESAGKRR